jgi:hypothetical protein
VRLLPFRAFSALGSAKNAKTSIAFAFLWDALNKLSLRGAKRRGNPEMFGKTKNWIASRHGLRPRG